MDAIISLMQQSLPVFLTTIFIFSLLVGSFLNVVIYRLPIMMERSWKAEYQSYFHENGQKHKIGLTFLFNGVHFVHDFMLKTFLL